MLTSGVIRQIFSQKMLICIFIGFSSGLPLYVLFTFLPYWLRKEQVDLATIGLFTLIGFPYTWKFVWAPLFDRFSIPWLGRRRGWIIVAQLLLFIGIIAFSGLNPQQNITLIAVLAVMLAFFSATQDIVLDAYRREILDDNEMGLGNSIYVNAYRLSGLIPGSLSIFLSGYYAWSSVFIITALFMLPGIFATLMLFFEKPQPIGTPKTLKDTIINPFMEYYQRKGKTEMLLVLAFLCLYKLGDAMATTLMTPFYVDMGYSSTDIALVAKNATLWPLLISSVIGGIIMLRIGINRALWLFGFVQITTILGFVWLSHFGKFEQIGTFELMALAGVLVGEYIGVGLGTTAFVAFITRETNPLYTATQFALFTSLTALPRTLLGSSAGVLVDNMGYYHFYWLCFFLAIPGMLLLLKVAPWNEKVVKNITEKG
ncbi:AmpG family muropeptide MFS transporter [Mergibacter septicus]|uniref:AmpG family muropeptide MFS transporter n=1 Tax=Mergibacter septicus TaxID=221402 RepID=UPI001179306A|nr:AmpG family muropeptide MFS transporter [Mergibacter septicus]AWX14549.1 AmpG family muropeptide MFS transporter [Mergibacter septicus]